MTHSPSLPARLESTFQELLKELSCCGHQANTLLERARLPRWCRKPLFFFLGYIAKADGQVKEPDIHYAEALMKALALSTRQRRNAIAQFRKGKASEHLPIGLGLMIRLTSLLWPAPALKTAICLCHGAQVLGSPGKARRYRCEDAISHIGLPVLISDDIFESYASKVWIRKATHQQKPTTYEQACQILGVTRRESLEAIKRAYRKQVSACHPDKLSQQNLTATELTDAKDRLLRYQQAWELIRQRHRQL
ncbi:molecular chaperone DjiA [Marinobacter daepoensis]|uniref:Molecular chaperone DjiA n=1 Tax=Marinobacter daepoensis TaxID=262077 RepID=A0ABS3BEQ2_9GAMM|nr:molecular chaperone DjiA [Marinobacter daepoensis]MBN7770311.1 molecular chaperone DjiA [Marinobacter daepoensis]MBY6033841.1 molecular chaperone DjiA [Marinobacter daepoensis]MBY6079757.1 molecular chaperone DjiA [Marinobacter daepoensis]